MNTIPSAVPTRVAASPSRRIYHPLQKDYATFLETSEESGGRRTLLEIELAPGGGNALHVHRSFAERFTAIEGELGVQVGNRRQVLRPGQTATAAAGVPHRFYGVAGEPARFRVEITPGHAWFEAALRIGYGLAADGRARATGMPRGLRELALVIDLSDTTPVGPVALLMPAFRLVARHARAVGVERALLERYCRG